MDAGRRFAGAAGIAASQNRVGSRGARRLISRRGAKLAESIEAVVLLSGGMDSCVTAAQAIDRHGSGRVGLLHASYGQRTEAREARAFSEIAKFYGIDRKLAVRLDYFRSIGGSALTDLNIAVPENELGAPGLAGGAIPVTYVPFRNAHFLSVAVSWAEASSANEIYIGAVAEDSSGYPDCRPEYYEAFQEIIRRGLELGAPLQLTWSCYQGEELACGACDSCLLRLRAFAEAGVADPIIYRLQSCQPSLRNAEGIGNGGR